MTLSRNPWSSRLAAGILWAGAAALAVFWGLRLSAPGGVATAPQAGAGPLAQADPQGLARIFGARSDGTAEAAAAPAGDRWKLLGVLAGKSSGGGAAVIALDGKPPKVYRVGAAVADGLVLQAMQSDEPRAVTLGASVDGPASVTISLPAIKALGAPASPASVAIPAPVANTAVPAPVPAPAAAAPAQPAPVVDPNSTFTDH
ncbi:MAG: type II secretion system protein N [Comamonas sp.]